MVRSGPREHGVHPRRRPTFVQPNLSQSDFQSLLAAAYAHKQALRAAVRAELGVHSEDLSGIVQLQNRISEVSSTCEQVLDLVVQRAMTITHASGAAIAIAETQAVICRSRAGPTAPALGVPVDPQSGFSGECLRSGDMLCCDDSEIDPRVNLAACRQLGIRSMLVVPIRCEQRVIGVLEVFSGWVGAFNQSQATALQLLAGLASDAMHVSALRTADSVQTPGLSAGEGAVTPDKREVTAASMAQSVSPREAERLSTRPAVAVAGLDTLRHYAREHRSSSSQRILLFAALASAAFIAILLGHSQHGVVPVQNLLRATQRPPAASPSPPVSTGEDRAPAVLTAIRFHSRREFSTVAFDLTSPVKYQSGRLHHPERIYFDLLNTDAATGLMSSSRSLAPDGHFVLRVRLASREGGLIRVVLDLNCACDYSSVVSSYPPYRLVIEMHPPSPAIHAASSATPRLAKSSEHTAFRASGGLANEATLVSAPMHIKIVIDPGHGGTDRGTIGPSGLQEKDLVLEVAQHLGKLVSDRLGAEVTYTRTGDYFVPLEARSALANSVSADLFVSIHANASDSRSVRGVETFYMDPHSAAQASLLTPDGVVSGGQHARAAKIAASRQLAAAVQHALYTRLAAINPQLRNRGVKPASLVVLLGPNMPSILTEISFISSASEERKLKDAKYCEHIVEALYLGITKYLSHTGTQTRHVVDRASVDRINQSRSHVGEQQTINK